MEQSRKRETRKFVSLLMIVFIPLLTLSFVYYYIGSKQLEQNARTIERNKLIQVGRTLERELMRLNDLAAIYANMNWISTIAYMPNGTIDYNRMDYYSIYQYSQMLRQFESCAPLSSRNAIVFADKPMAISNEGGWPVLALLDSEMSTSYCDAKSMLELLVSNPKQMYIYPQSKHDRYLYVVTKLPYFGTPLNVQMLTRIELPRLGKLLAENTNQMMSIFSPDGYQLTSTGGWLATHVPQEGECPMINGEAYIPFSYVLPLNNWTITSLVPRTELLRDVLDFRSSFAIVLCGIVSFVAIALLVHTHRTCRPLEALYIGDMPQKYEEDSAMNWAISPQRSICEWSNLHFNAKTDIFEPLARTTFFMKVIRSALPVGMVELLAPALNVSMTSQGWLMAVFAFDPLKREVLDARLKDTDIYLLHVENGRLLLIENTDNAERSMDTIRAIALAEGASAGISSVHMGIHELSDAYLEACMALDHVANRPGVAMYNKLAESKPMVQRRFEELEHTYLGMLRAGNFEGARSLIAQSVDSSMRSVSLLSFRYPLYRLLSAALRLCKHDNILQTCIDDDLFLSHDTAELKSLLLRITQKICFAKNNYDQGSYRRQRGNELHQYVMQHYADPDLTLETLATSFGITPQYASKLYKDGSGSNFQETLQMLRVEKSKALLNRRDMTLQQICLEVGFSNTAAFRRAFKKYEGITPSEYRAVNATHMMVD